MPSRLRINVCLVAKKHAHLCRIVVSFVLPCRQRSLFAATVTWVLIDACRGGVSPTARVGRYNKEALMEKGSNTQWLTNTYVNKQVADIADLTWSFKKLKARLASDGNDPNLFMRKAGGQPCTLCPPSQPHMLLKSRP